MRIFQGLKKKEFNGRTEANSIRGIVTDLYVKHPIDRDKSTAREWLLLAKDLESFILLLKKQARDKINEEAR